MRFNEHLARGERAYGGPMPDWLVDEFRKQHGLPKVPRWNLETYTKYLNGKAAVFEREARLRYRRQPIVRRSNRRDTPPRRVHSRAHSRRGPPRRPRRRPDLAPGAAA